jgi:hypothetical protein
MSKKGGWDLTSRHSMESAAEWIRKKGAAQVVLVIRPDDVAFAVDPQIAPKAARELVELIMPEVQVYLDQKRAAERDAAAEKAKWRKG